MVSLRMASRLDKDCDLTVGCCRFCPRFSSTTSSRFALQQLRFVVVFLRSRKHHCDLIIALHICSCIWLSRAICDCSFGFQCLRSEDGLVLIHHRIRIGNLLLVVIPHLAQILDCFLSWLTILLWSLMGAGSYFSAAVQRMLTGVSLVIRRCRSPEWCFIWGLHDILNCLFYPLIRVGLAGSVLLGTGLMGLVSGSYLGLGSLL